MKKTCDVLVVGAGTAGTYYAWLLAQRGVSVTVLERDDRSKVGKRLDVFHIDSVKFDEFGVPAPVRGAKEFICVLKDNVSLSPDGSYPKVVSYPFHVMRLTPFLQRLYGLAEKAGVSFRFNTPVASPILKGGRLEGVVAGKGGNKTEYRARVVVDATGTAAALRTSLPQGFGVETFSLAPDDRFYVVLRYLRWKDPKGAGALGPWRGAFYPAENRGVGWTYFKTWIAPSSDPRGAILGIGATGSYEHAEEVLKVFLSKIPLPPYRVDRIERGSTPYRRPPYSVVGDGFICLGDSACITKPFSGEGVTAAWRLCGISAEETVRALAQEGAVLKERLWNINVRYFRGQGAKFAALLATLPGAANSTEREVQYLFKEDVIFSVKDLADMNEHFEVKLSIGRLLKVVFVLLKGLVTGNYSAANLRGLAKALGASGKIKAHYEAFPEKAGDFEGWVHRAETLWERAGAKMK
ncbi:MAG: NAD(P)/FAD-dependent oxidoreductase [Spirochaetes bacterium]|nr:NAD(P)/FAD-dependent oxidoreductase [Spirochaetota bacterium]